MNWIQKVDFSSNDLPAKVNGFCLNAGAIYAYGKFGNFNIFMTQDNGSTWVNSVFGVSGEIKTMSFYPNANNIYFLGISSSNEDIIYTWNNYQIINKLELGIKINIIGSLNVNQILAGTNNGVYISTDLGKTWKQSGLKGQNVKSFASFNNDNVDLVGTQSGLFYNYLVDSIDCGPYQNADIDFLFLNKDGSLYIKTSKNEFFRSSIGSINNSFPIPTTLIYPSNSSINMDTNLTFRWIDMEEGSPVTYLLQFSENSIFNGPSVYSSGLIKENYYNVVNLKSKTKYYWRVRTFMSLKTSTWSDVSNFTTR